MDFLKAFMKLLCTSQIHSPRRFYMRVLQAVVGHRREGVGAAQLGDGLYSLAGLSNDSCPGAAAHLGAGTVASVVSASAGAASSSFSSCPGNSDPPDLASKLLAFPDPLKILCVVNATVIAALPPCARPPVASRRPSPLPGRRPSPFSSGSRPPFLNFVGGYIMLKCTLTLTALFHI